jgi:hypothetical protein
VLLGAAAASLVAVGVVLFQASAASGNAKYLTAGLALVSLFVSWALVHTVFTLKYARLYYCGTSEESTSTVLARPITRLRLPVLHDRDDVPGLPKPASSPGRSGGRRCGTRGCRSRWSRHHRDVNRPRIRLAK